MLDQGSYLAIINIKQLGNSYRVRDVFVSLLHLLSPSSLSLSLLHTHMHISPGKAASSGTIPKSLPENANEPVGLASDGEKGCESCRTVTSTRWYHWGSAHDHCRLCTFCYTYWRKYAGLKLPNKWGKCVLCVCICVCVFDKRKKCELMLSGVM